MSRMIRKQIYIDPTQEARLKQCAQELGVSEAELIRRCLDDLERQAVALSVDQRAWEEELAFMQARAQSVPSRQGHRQWTREELYAERTETAFFVDTNVLVYAYDPEEGDKRSQAMRVLARFGTTRRGSISAHVLGEFCHGDSQDYPTTERGGGRAADNQLCLDLGNSGKMGSKMPIRPISHPERDADPNELAVAHWPGAAENPDALGE